uniref:Uncharacterized protein n=1 Tax=Oryza rufipogon TaxID=4529 RepID=A0A0E0QLP0_ORYRU
MFEGLKIDLFLIGIPYRPNRSCNTQSSLLWSIGFPFAGIRSSRPPPPSAGRFPFAAGSKIRRRGLVGICPHPWTRLAPLLIAPPRVDALRAASSHKVEVNLLRLLEAAPRQQNQAKLVHYVTTARELLEQLGAETTPEGISSVSKAKTSEYSEKIEALAARLAAPEPENEMPVDENREVESSYEGDKPGSPISLSSGLRRRPIAHNVVGPSSHERKDRDIGAPIKLDEEAQAHIEKHRKLQEDLTDEMVELARQLKESSLTMHQSVQETEKLSSIAWRALGVQPREQQSDFEIDYGSEERASIVYKTLAVDKELQPDKVKREMSVSGGKLVVHFEAVEARFLRASFSAFVDLTVLVTKLVEEYGISKEGEGSI